MARSLRTRFLETLRARLGGEPLPLRIVFWDGEAFDFAAAPKVTLTLASRHLIRRFLLGDIDGLGAAYVKGEIGVEGRIEDVLAIGIRIAERLGASPALRRIGQVGALVPRRRFRHTRRRDAAAVRYHYDVSNDFYRLWLDRNMVYSCAYFATGEEDLDTAQEQKLDHLCRKLRLKPGERLLDIGCGWGGLLNWAATRYGITGVGATVSERQRAYAAKWTEKAGLARQVEIRLQDYREIADAGAFDKIVSVGMYEHVGIANLPHYFGVIGRLLRPGGIALNHGITAGDRDGRAQGPPGGGFIDRFVFPGGAVPHISRVLYEVAGAGLEILDVEDLRPHYPQTLARWVARLEAAREAAIAAAGAERYRIWRMYMAGMAHAFDRGWLSVCQTLAQKPRDEGMAPRPWTRRYQYEPAIDPAMSRALDWGRRSA